MAGPSQSGRLTARRVCRRCASAKQLRFAQYGISHDHAAGKARVIRESAQAELAGVYEPSPQVREALGTDPAYEGVHWFSSEGRDAGG